MERLIFWSEFLIIDLKVLLNFLNRLFANYVIAVARNAAGGQEVIFLHRNQ